MPTTRLCRAFVALLLISTPLRADPPPPEQLDFFEKKIRPLLVENCYQCHSDEAQKKRKLRAGLFLDSRAGMLKGGDTGPAVVPGALEKTLLLKAISYTDRDLKMPPKGKLSEGDIADLTAWIKMGAPWPEGGAGAKVVVKPFNLDERRQHWSLQPVQRSELPAVKNKAWPLTGIDRFIMAKLEAKGLQPSPPADPATLLRRLHFDLIGLPPTPEEVETFVKEYAGAENAEAKRQARTQSDDRREAVIANAVDRLLASPHYGERWGRHWLDLVRFAETHGHEFDFEIPEAHRYRDYVIRALNADVPYDQFVKEHIAGDLLPEPRQHAKEKFNESIIGTGFWWLGEAKHSPVDVRGDQADRVDNQIDVFSKTFLGTTVACAKCHDHKFDAVTQRDYYALAGFLQSGRQQRAFVVRHFPDPVTKITMDLLHVGLQEEYRHHQAAAIQEQIRKFVPADREGTGIQPWQELSRRAAKAKLAGLAPLLGLLSLEGEKYTAARRQFLDRGQEKGSKGTLFADFSRGKYETWFPSGAAFGPRPLQPTDLVVPTSVPLPLLAGAHVAHSGQRSPHLQGALRSPTFTIKHRFIHYLAGGEGTRINLILDGLQLIRDPIYGGLTLPLKGGHERRWVTQNVSMWQGHRAYIEVIDDGPGFASLERVVFSDEGPPAPVGNPWLMQLLAHKEAEQPDGLATRLVREVDALAGAWKEGKGDVRLNQPGALELLAELARLFPVPAGSKGEAEVVAKLKEYRAAEGKLPGPVRVLAMEEGSPINERLHIRGNHKNLGEEVPRRFLEVLVGKGPAQTRLELAEQVASAKNPLTARVMVNRLWKHHFGEGLVRTVDDFGVLGQLPSHSELLDWLANEFVEQGWSLKKMHRLMVISAVYRQQSAVPRPALEADPSNVLLHRYPVRRLEGEAIRDSLLAVSGRLDRTQFGPGVMPHLTPHMAGRGRPGASGPLDGNGRRSIYINVRRNFLTPLLLVYDYPVPFSTMGRRSVSNVPAQALTLLNNPFVLQQADLWAKKTLAAPDLSHRQRIERMYLTAFARRPSAEELTDALAFVEMPPAASRAEIERQWADLAHVLINVKEFVYLN